MRPAAGAVQVRATVLTSRRVDAYHALTLVAPPIAARFRPGQFVTVAVGGPQSSMLGRRAFAVHDVRPDHGGTVEFVFEAVGPGTRWLAGLRARDPLDVTGPLGRPFPVPKSPSRCLLLGVGYGSAPLFALAAKLADRGCTVDYLLGGRSADRVFGALTARRSGRSATVATADGSLGARGPVTAMLEQVIREARTEVIYACAPVPVLRDVAALAARYSIPVQASVDVPMACGIGVCMGCVLPVTGTDGITRIVRACVDGPVFRADLVRWDDVGTIPFDALGAPGWRRGDHPERPPRTQPPLPRGQDSRPMPADMRARLGQVGAAESRARRGGLRGRGPRAGPVHRRRPGRGDHQQVDHDRAADRQPGAPAGRNPERPAQLGGLAGPGH